MAEKALHKEESKKEPFITITKRDNMPLKNKILVYAASIIAAFIACSIITLLLTKDNPISIMKTMVEGAVGNSLLRWVTLHDIAILLCISLAVTPAFRMKFWNTGAEGQVLIGGLATATIMFLLGGQIPDWLLIIVMLAGALAAGMIWGLLPAFFKAQWKTNETLFTLMMNYVAIQLIEYFLKVVDKTGSNVVGPSILKYGWLPSIFGQRYLINVLIVAAVLVFMHVYLNYSKHGYEISVVGESENTAKYIGINVKKVILRTMALSGAVCGLVGFLLVGGASHSIDANTASGRGFTAIMVSWLAKFNPLMMILTTSLLVFLSRGAVEVSTKFGLNTSFSDILTGVILFFIIGSEFFIRYKVNFKKSAKEAE